MKHKNWKNKLLSALMAAVMTLSLLPATALAVTVDDTYVPGTYTGTAQGLKGSVSVSLTLSDGGTISDITAASESETPTSGQKPSISWTSSRVRTAPTA